MIPVCPSFMYSFNRSNTEGTKFDVCACMFCIYIFYVCVGIGFVDEKSFEMCICLWQFDCPEVTHCGGDPLWLTGCYNPIINFVVVPESIFILLYVLHFLVSFCMAHCAKDLARDCAS